MSYFATDYATSADLKAYLRIDDTDDDAQIALALTAASRAIDRACSRAFGLDDPAVARHWTFERASNTYSVYGVTDISQASGVTVKADTTNDGVFDTTVPVDKYQLLPVDAGVNGRPYTDIAVHQDVVGPDGVFRIEVSAKFGWTAVPDAIKQACLIQASRILKRRESPFGIAGSPDLGSELRLLEKLDPDVGVLIQHYKRRWAVV